MEVNIKIRTYKNSDENVIRKMFQSFSEYFAGIDPLKLCIVKPTTADFHFQTMITRAEKEQGKILVATQGEKIIGFAAGIIINIPESDPETISLRKGRVIELFVAEKFRGKFIGSDLMEHLDQYFKSQDCVFVNVEVFGPNQNGYNFYKKLGFGDRNYDLIKKL